MNLKRTGNEQFYIMVCSMLFLLAAVFLTVPIQAESQAPQTVRIGYYYDSDYYYQNSSGAYCGYDVEYIYEISKYTDWKFEYVNFDSFEDAYAALESGKIDLLPALFYSPERAETLLLSNYDMGSIYVTIVVAPSDNRIAYNDKEALRGKKVGILSDSVDGETFRSWAALNNLNVQIVTQSSTTELLQSLDSGALDAVAISYLGSSSKYPIIAEFSPMKMYFGMPKDHLNLMQQLNEAMSEIAIETPDFTQNLYNRYYMVNQGQIPVFSEKEKAYIASSGTITVALPDNDPPFSYMGKNGKLTGAMVDYYKRISHLSGLKFSFISETSETDTVNAVKNGKVDIAGAMIYDAVAATNDEILLTNSYTNMAVTEISLKGTKNIEKLGIPSYLTSVYSSQISPGDTSDAKDQTAVVYDTSEKCITALKSKKVDGVILNTYSANYYMNTGRVGRYNLTALNGFTYHVAAGISSSADRNLYSILNRCIRYSNITTLNELIVKYSQADTSSLSATIERISPVWLIGIGLLMLLSILFLILSVVSLKRHQKEKEAIAFQKANIAIKENELALVEKNAEEKNQFFANISHDMRTPLNAILGFTTLAKKEGVSHEQRTAYLDKIQSSGELLLNLINDTLTMSKVNSGKLEIHPQPIPTEVAGNSIVTPIRAIADQKKITFTLDKSGYRARTILVDPLILQKIFLNLLNNAVKYTPEGGHISVTVKDIPENSPTPDTVFTIQDDGIGISREFLPHIFEPFSQEKRQGYESVGTGLGLSIVKQLVDLLHGTIEVQSEENKGTTFTVRLHFTETEAPQTPVQKIESENKVDLAGKKVLLCEDNALNREISVAFLKDRGMNTVTAEDGQIGVKIFSESALNEISAILMDIRMPNMNGFEATKEIRSLPRADAQTVPIIAMTADAFADDIQKCLDSGMNGHVAKPIDPLILYAELSKFIK